jgi:hypothetical protein
MRRRALDAYTAPVAAVTALTAIGLAGRSFLAGAALLVLVPLVFRTSWWMPGAAALVLLAAAPVYAGLGDAASANVLATLVILLAAMSLVHLVVLERKRVQSSAGG